VAPTQLAAGPAELFGVTTDGYAIYRGSVQPGSYAIAVTGGTPQTVLSTSDWIYVHGSVVVGLGGYNPTCSDEVSMQVWTAAHGNVPISGDATSQTVNDIVAVNPDGSQIAFQSGAARTGCSADAVVVASTAGSGGREILPTPPAGNYISADVWLSYGANGTLFVGTAATAAADGGSQGMTSYVFSKSPRPVTSVVGTGRPDPSGAFVWVALPDGSAELVSSSTGDVVSTFPAGSSFPAYDATGAHAYIATNGALEELTLGTTPTVKVLVPSGVSDVKLVSPDGTYLVDVEQAPGDAGATATFVRPLAPGGTPTLITNDSSDYLFFTADSKYVLDLHSDFVAPNSVNITLSSFAPGSSTPRVTISSPGSFRMLHGSLVLLEQGVVFDASGATPTWSFGNGGTLAFPAQDGASIVYSDSTGLYVIPSP
jgi:hypothetical protein